MKQGYNKENHLASLRGLVHAVKKEWPDEDVYVDEDTAEVVWGMKSRGQDKNINTKDVESSFDEYRKGYPWL